MPARGTVKVKRRWAKLSRHLQRVARRRGPVPIDDTAREFQSVHRKQKQLCSYLHGRTLQSLLENGDVRGVWFNADRETMELGGSRGAAKRTAAILATKEITPTTSTVGGASTTSNKRKRLEEALTAPSAPGSNATQGGTSGESITQTEAEGYSSGSLSPLTAAASITPGSASTQSKASAKDERKKLRLKEKKAKKSKKGEAKVRVPISPTPAEGYSSGSLSPLTAAASTTPGSASKQSKASAKNERKRLRIEEKAKKSKKGEANVRVSISPTPTAEKQRTPAGSASKAHNDSSSNTTNNDQPVQTERGGGGGGGGGSMVPIERELGAPTMPSRKKARTTGPEFTPYGHAYGYQPRLVGGSYRLINSLESCRMALTFMFAAGGREGSTQLKHVCERRVVAVHLDGSGLGTADERLSLIKVSSGRQLRVAVVVQGVLFLHGNLDLIPEEIPKLGHDVVHTKIPGRLSNPIAGLAQHDGVFGPSDLTDEVEPEIAGPWGHPGVMIFDVVALERTTGGQAVLRDQLFPMFEDQASMKVVHDATSTAIILRRHFGTTLKFGCLLDTQLAFELLHGDLRGNVIVAVRNAVSVGPTVSRDAASRTPSIGQVSNTSRLPRPRELVRAAQVISSFSKTAKEIMHGLSYDQLNHLLPQASQLRMTLAMSSMDGSRLVTFRDHGSCWGGGAGRAMMSYELKQAQATTEQPLAAGAAPRSSDGDSGSVLGRMEQGEEDTAAADVNCPLEVLKLVPKVFRKEHLSKRQKKNLQDLQEIVLDEGRRPTALMHGRGRIFLCSDEGKVVTAKHIDKVVGPLEREGRFGDDNRAGFPGKLHRVSVLRGRKKHQIFGVTLRIGRFFKGSAALIDDLLFRVVDTPDRPKRAASILVLGEPGSGKTTVIRDISRKVSATQTVVIVDTSNEIAGDGSIPHREAIGASRRIMVPHRADQHRVMTEALQNHTPQTIVVDEISNNLEARACVDIKARGVRLVASAHGDFQSLIRNPELNTVLGGTRSVTVGDETAKATRGHNKVQTQRAGAPVFDVIVEVKCGKVATWSIIRNVAVAVDALLSGSSYEVERRTRTEHDSHLSSKHSTSEDVTFRLAYQVDAERSQLL